MCLLQKRMRNPMVHLDYWSCIWQMDKRAAVPLNWKWLISSGKAHCFTSWFKNDCKIFWIYFSSWRARRLVKWTAVIMTYNMSWWFRSSLNTPPGTKIKLKGLITVKHGFLLLNKTNTKYLGGRVSKLVEPWEVKRVSNIIITRKTKFISNVYPVHFFLIMIIIRKRKFISNVCESIENKLISDPYQ